MTPTTIAETILRDVPRYASPDGNLLAEEHVLAALAAAVPDDLAEAGKVLENLRDERTIATRTEAADTITALIARIAAMEAQIKGLEGGIEAACDREAETERKLRTALAASETRAEAAETALVAERAKTAKLVEAGKDAADDWAECLGHVVTALGEKPDWYGHEVQAIAAFRAAITEASQ